MQKQNEILLEFWKEQRNRKLFSTLSIFLTSISMIVFLTLLFWNGYLGDTRLAILLYWTIFTNISSILIQPYFQIPKLILNLTNENSEISQSSWLIIQENRKVFLLPFLKRIGYYCSESELNKMTMNQTIEHFKLMDRLNWKKIGFYYLIFYLSISPIVLYFFFSSLIVP